MSRMSKMDMDVITDFNFQEELTAMSQNYFIALPMIAYIIFFFGNVAYSFIKSKYSLTYRLTLTLGTTIEACVAFYGLVRVYGVWRYMFNDSGLSFIFSKIFEDPKAPDYTKSFVDVTYSDEGTELFTFWLAVYFVLHSIMYMLTNEKRYTLYLHHISAIVILVSAYLQGSLSVVMYFGSIIEFTNVAILSFYLLPEDSYAPYQFAIVYTFRFFFSVLSSLLIFVRFESYTPLQIACTALLQYCITSWYVEIIVAAYQLIFLGITPQVN